MASSGTIQITTESVDYNGGGPHTRGAVYLYNTVGWSVNDNGDISFWSISSTDNAGGTWGICGTTTGYGVAMEPQVSYDNGATWVSLSAPFHAAAICPSLTNTISISTTLIGQLGTHHLSGDCQLRILYYANREPAPSASLPNAFPSSSYSAAVQVPVHIDVSWTATLNYNANGGSGAPSTQTHSQSGDSYNFTISNTVPTRTHHRFDGWSLSSSASTPSYHGGDTFTVSKSDPTKTLYAVWTKYYHPGAVLDGNSKWMSHDRSSGACQSLSNVAQSTWHDMRTIDAPTGLGDPPATYHNSKWFNQKKIGKE